MCTISCKFLIVCFSDLQNLNAWQKVTSTYPKSHWQEINLLMLFYTKVMGDSSQLTPLSTICEKPGPVIWFPLFLSLAFPLSIASFAWRNLIWLWTYASKASKISKRDIFCAMKYIMLTFFLWDMEKVKIKHHLNWTEDLWKNQSIPIRMT